MLSETYDTIVSILQSTFDVSVAERTQPQRSAVVRYWRGMYFAR